MRLGRDAAWEMRLLGDAAWERMYTREMCADAHPNGASDGPFAHSALSSSIELHTTDGAGDDPPSKKPSVHRKNSHEPVHIIHRLSRDLAGAPRSVRVCSLMPFVHVAWLPKVPHKPAIVAPRILLTTLRIPYADLPDCCSAERGGRSDHQGHDKCQEC